MQVCLDKHKAVKTKPIKYEEALPKRVCFFSPEHKISITQATITEAKFGFPLCPECVRKVEEIIEYMMEFEL